MFRFFRNKRTRGKQSRRGPWRHACLQVEGLEVRAVPTFYAAGASPSFLAAGDFDKDGFLDLAVTNRTVPGNVSILLNSGTGAFPAIGSSPVVGGNPLSVRAADFNGDGNLDLAVANSSSANLSILLGNGNGTFQAPSTVGVSGGPRILAVADFNGDGKMDLAAGLQGSSSTSIAVLLGNGDGTFQAPSIVTVGTGPSWVEAADFNGDGKTDLATANAVSGTVSIMLGAGNGTFTQAPNSPVTVGSMPSSVAAADFNGDGRIDLAVSNFTDSTISILQNGGGGSYTVVRTLTLTAGSSPRYLIAGQFSPDTAADLVVVSSGRNEVLEFRGNGNGTFKSAANLGSFASSANPYAALVRDFNNDGGLDLAVALLGSNQVDVMLSIAPTIISGSTVTFTVGVAGTVFVVDGTGFLPPSLTVAGALPSGVTFTDDGNGRGTFSGTPAAGSGKVYNLTITAANGKSPNATQSFTLRVNEAPKFTSAATTTFTAGSAGTFTITTQGFPRPAITRTGALPPGVTFTDNGNGTATLSGTPAFNSAGNYTLSLMAANGIGANAAQTFTLRVNAPAPFTAVTPLYFPADIFGPHPNADATTSFIHGLYWTVLGRAGSAGEVANWVGQMNAGMSREAVVQAFLTSTERYNNLVNYYYRSILGRSADSSGLSYYVGLMQGGWTGPQVIASLMTSAEFTAKNTSNFAFASSLYTLLLFRDADGSGLSYWVSQLDGGLSRQSAVQEFLRNSEAANNAVRGFYLSILLRQPDPGALQYYGGAISSGAMSYDAVMAALLTSPEFYGNAQRAVP